jgi:hypothetical protein
MRWRRTRQVHATRCVLCRVRLETAHGPMAGSWDGWPTRPRERAMKAERGAPPAGWEARWPGRAGRIWKIMRGAQIAPAMGHADAVDQSQVNSTLEFPMDLILGYPTIGQAD